MNEEERIHRFEAAYNRIDHALTEMTARGADSRKNSYTAKVRIAANQRRSLGKYKDFLLEAGELRNALVHNRTGGDEYIAVPSEKTVLELERIEQAAFSPERVLPRFEKHVVCVQSDQMLAEAWKLVRGKGFSRYPVYDGNVTSNGEGAGRFVGLLTSNGFARWAADQLNGTRLEVDTATVRVADVVAHDHHRASVAFVSRDTLIDDVDQMFREMKPLEAVIITAHGKPNEKPLGMICAQDLAAMNR